MSNTPETDAFAIKFKTLCGEKYWVPVDLARQFERERDEAIRQRNETNESSVFSCNFYYEEKLKAERDDLQKAINGLCEHFKISPANTTLLAVEVLRIERERDEAWDMVEKLTEQGLKLMDDNMMLKREIKKLKKKYE